MRSRVMLREMIMGVMVVGRLVMHFVEKHSHDVPVYIEK